MNKGNWKFEISCAFMSGSDGSSPDKTGGSEGTIYVLSRVDDRTR